MVWRQEKPEESKEYKGEGREDKKKRNMQNRVLHSVEGGFKKNKAAQRANKQIFCLPGNQMKLLGNYWHTNPQGRTESRNVKHWCLWQIILAVGMSCPCLLPLAVQKCRQMMQWEVQKHIRNLPQKPTFVIWKTKHSPWALYSSAAPVCQHGAALVVKMTGCPVLCGTGKCDLPRVSAGLQHSAWSIF